MLGFTNTQCLVLHSTDLDYFPEDINDFTNKCEKIGFLSLEDKGLDTGYYLTGENFLQQITFMGCSPYLKIYPDDENDTDFCSVFIPATSQTAKLITSKQARCPFCPQCKKTLPVDMSILIAKTVLSCPNCQCHLRADELDWRRNAGFVNFAIVISNIFPKEAIPTEGLLNGLSQITGGEWKFFYTDFSEDA